MPSDLTIFAAKYLVFVDAVLAAVMILLAVRWWDRPRLFRYTVIALLILVLSYAFARVGAGVYTDPRPFTQDHVRPLIAHAADNGFPSDHALLAAAIVALVALVSPLWAAPFAVLGVLVDWARVGAGIHHVADVVGSSLFVALATGIALLATPLIVRRLAPVLPPSLGGTRAHDEMVGGGSDEGDTNR
ncbi:MAG TPA: phosphatase PAP2 family protein [Chloroflexota bacterium]|nr:phosphatase PAP2 family protein [Chloroflexota bacterium]